VFTDINGSNAALALEQKCQLLYFNAFVLADIDLSVMITRNIALFRHPENGWIIEGLNI
jgi:hypothetical protein